MIVRRLLLCLCAAMATAAPTWDTLASTTTPPGPALRGYGSVGTTTSALRDAAGRRVSVTRFACADADHARTLAGKFLADLGLSPGVAPRTVTVGGQSVPMVVTPGGAAFIIAVDGAQARVLCADDAAALTDFATSRADLLRGAVDKSPYPAYLDRFDRYGWGFYGLGGYGDDNWMSYAAGFDGQKGFKDPKEDLAFLTEHHYRFEGWLDPAIFDFSDGITKNTEAEWLVGAAARAGLPSSFRVYGDAGGAHWSGRRFADYLEQPAPFLMSGWHGYGLGNKSNPHLTWYDRDIQRYMAARTMGMMQPFAKQDSTLGWMHPQGELYHDEWYNLHDDYSPRAQRSWRDFLRRRGLDLTSLAAMYRRPQGAFADWDQVPIPEYATFAGLDGLVLDLGGTWWLRADKGGPGQAESWWQTPIAGAPWQAAQLPGGDELYRLLPPNNDGATWLRRSFELTEAQLARGRVYLYAFPISDEGLHKGAQAKFHGLWVNGGQAGEFGTWGALDITDRLHPGDNQIAIRLLGRTWNGRIFLSTSAPQVYPYLGAATNRLWELWHEWHVQAKYDAWWDILDGMRQVDGDRPIKFMAPMGHGSERWLTLAHDWGGFGHFTGEGIWYFPWYKRYGFLYDVPGSSETAGPANNVAEQFDSYRRVFLAGLNAHDEVFLAQWYTRHPELRQWLLDHEAVLKRLGRQDLDAAQQVLLYRSTRMDIGLLPINPSPAVGPTRETQRPWEWDLGRGTLQTLGQSCLYLDDKGVTDGKMAGYPLMIDSGNEMMPAASVARIAEWVRAGGTFVALPFTGRSTDGAPDSWPIRALTGCEIARSRTPGQGTVTVGARQSVFRALAGRTYPDAGHSVDHQGGEHNLLSVELKPGADGEVLATYENGAAAIVRRKLGTGSVIVLGSAFWRDSRDILGLWWPQPLETEFIADLLAGSGFGAAPCTTDDRLVWAQPYRADNGLDAVTVLVSWHNDTAADVTLRLRPPRRPSRLTAFAVGGQRDLPFDWADGVATAMLRLAAKEAAVVNAEVYSAGSALAHWWDYQQRMWHATARPTLDFAPYSEGRWADPTLDLRPDAALTTTAPPAEWDKPGFEAKAWTPCQLSVLEPYGARADQPVWVRRPFTVPAEWRRRGGRIYLISGAWAGLHYQGSARLTLNGTQLHDYTTNNYQEYDITRLLADGENVAGWQFRGDGHAVGFTGNVWLYWAAPPDLSLDLAGAWQATDAQGKPASVTLPGGGRFGLPSRQVAIPEVWRGRYRVRLYLEGSPYGTRGAWVNGRLIRRHHHNLGPRCDIDITDALHFGQDNEIRLEGPADDTRFVWDVRTVRLDLYRAE